MPNKYLDSVQLGRLVTKIKDHVSTSISTAISGSITTLINQAKAEAILAAHPVGSYYWSDDSTSPATLFGGTWQALPAGYTLIAQGSGTDSFGNFTYTAGQTYGERMHTLTVGEIAEHGHERGTMEITGSFIPRTNSGFGVPQATGAFYGSSQTSNYIVPNTEFSGSTYRVQFEASRSWTGKTSMVGSDNAHNNIQPCKAAYGWIRTA